MKKILFSVFAFLVILLLSSCSNGSSGTAMLDLDIRIMPDKEDTRMNDPRHRQEVETLCNLFTVLPGPYEFTWDELKNVDGTTGREQCSTKLKIKLRLNKTLKSMSWGNKPLTEEKMLETVGKSYDFEAFNAEGKISNEVDIEFYTLFLQPELEKVWGADGKISYKENIDGIRDFYQFLTSKPGTEYTLILDCGIHLCKDIEDAMAYTKGIFITPRTHGNMIITE